MPIKSIFVCKCTHDSATTPLSEQELQEYMTQCVESSLCAYLTLLNDACAEVFSAHTLLEYQV